MRVLASLATSLLVTAQACTGHAANCQLSEPERATVAQVKDAETLELSDGSFVRLIGARTPQPPLGWKGREPWPFVAEANEMTKRLALGKDVELRFGGNQTDRHGYKLAQVYVLSDGRSQWLQQELINAGVARVYSFPDNTACVDELLVSEAEARAVKRGIWSSWAYRILDATDTDHLGRLSHTYQLVEGRVAAIGKTRERLYLNFGEDWRTDFTISVAAKDIAAFKQADSDLESLAGRRIRVRGWIEWRNGPMIVADHPEQIELLPEDKKEAGPAGGSSQIPGRLNQ
jgi:micrococcal nuclease